MIAKLIVWGGDRRQALARMRQALAQYRVVGVANNVEFLWAPRGASFSKSVGQTFYPGDAYVDWIGGSAVPLDNWNSFGSIFDGFYSWGSQQTKPLFIWVGIRENPNSTAWKASWISDMSATIRQSMPAVKAFV